MRALARRGTPLALVVVLAGCSLVGLPQAETPAQKFYAAQGTYLVVASVAADYVESPAVDPRIKLTIQDFDRKAFAQIEAANLAAKTLSGANRDAQLELYARALALISDQLRAYLVTKGVTQ